MDNLLGLASQVANIGFPTLLVLIILGSRAKVWVWGWQLEDCEKRAVIAVTVEREIAADWKAIGRDYIVLGREAVNELAASRRRGKESS